MKKLFFSILPVMLVAALFMTSAYAAGPDGAVPYAAGAYQSEDVPIGSSNEVLMVGTVEPTIMSVTMPTYVPFHIARSVQGENKVISPRITVTNNSSVPVSLDVIYTSVDLSKLQGTTWNNGQYVGENQIAIGFQLETLTNQMPTSFDGTKWLWANTQQDLNVMSLGAYDNSTMYVVGTLGSGVPENNTFSVIPTFIVRQA
ncbi:MAG: hypothetical protein HFF15_03180 [Angelakisella sp.]|jgi:hypothetical protein|nr:hypothetical protein [Angelakisella sp.]